VYGYAILDRSICIVMGFNCSKVKVKVKVKVTLAQATKAETGSKSIALLFNLGARCRVDGQGHAPGALPPGKTRYPL
jgi:hypothetical protein